MQQRTKLTMTLLLLLTAATGAWAQTTATKYTVKMKKETTDVERWTVDPEAATTTGVEEKTAVSLTYGGELKVKRVKAFIGYDLGLLTDADLTDGNTLIVRDGMTLTGTLNRNIKILIADGATVTLAGVTIEGENNDNYEWAGITCEGDATIVLEDGTNNTVKGFRVNYPGIYVPESSKLIIKGGSLGTGSLMASSNGHGAGIGGGTVINCGAIEIQGGKITANGGDNSAGIGSGDFAHWDDITISGGEVMAIGGSDAAGIGSGYLGGESGYGNISIMGGTVIATGGIGAAGIGCGRGMEPDYMDASSDIYAKCGVITISGGTVTAIGGEYAVGIGNGQEYSTCGAININSTVNGVTARKGSGAANSIGNSGGSNCSCGTVTIGGIEYWKNNAYVGDGANYLTQATIYYIPIKDFSISDENYSIGIGDYITLYIIDIEPENASNQTFTWSVDRDYISIVSIGGDTKSCYIKGNSDGSVKVCATANDGSNEYREIEIIVDGSYHYQPGWDD